MASGLTSWSGIDASVVGFTVDSTRALAKINKLRADVDKVEASVGAANALLARKMQTMIADALSESITERGRAQRPSGLLFKAIQSEKSREFGPGGFSVGDFERAEAKVKYYYRNLERGTDVHRGQRLMVGYWLDVGGNPVVPSAALDAVAFTKKRTIENERTPRFRINKPITGYHYIRRASERFKREFLTGSPPKAAMVYATVISKRTNILASTLMAHVPLTDVDFGRSLKGVK